MYKVRNHDNTIYNYLTLIYLTTGGVGKVRRNMENLHAYSQATHKEVVELREEVTKIYSKIDAVLLQVHRATFQNVMQGADISEFFPVESNEQLEQFMDRSHPEWNSRKTEFYHYLYTIASEIKKGFARGMIKALFSRQYIVAVKWPSTG